jgi:hypothetical protein
MTRYNGYMTITLELPSDVGLGLQKIAAAEGKDLPTYVVEKIRQQLRTDVLPRDEAALLARINTPLCPKERAQRDALLSLPKRTQEEENELVRLMDLVEIANAERWQAIGELGQLRGKSIIEMARELEIPSVM